MKGKIPALSMILLFVVQLACNAPARVTTPDTFATLNQLYTASALTQSAGVPGGISATPGLPPPTVVG